MSLGGLDRPGGLDGPGGLSGETTHVLAADLPALVGHDFGVSEWCAVTQHDIDLFAEATGDSQWIHIDPEAAAKGPFGGAIAHGFLTLSLLPALLRETARVAGYSMGINYGLGRVRFPAAVPAGGEVRLRAVLQDAARAEDHVQATWLLTLELRGSEKPACVAETLSRYILERLETNA